jgi:hypothetical protein
MKLHFIVRDSFEYWENCWPTSHSNHYLLLIRGWLMTFNDNVLFQSGSSCILLNLITLNFLTTGFWSSLSDGNLLVLRSLKWKVKHNESFFSWHFGKPWLLDKKHSNFVQPILILKPNYFKKQRSLSSFLLT